MEITLTQEEQKYIREQVIERYINTKVQQVLEHPEEWFVEEKLTSVLAKTLTKLIANGAYDKELITGLKSVLEDYNYFFDLLHSAELDNVLKEKLLQLIK